MPAAAAAQLAATDVNDRAQDAFGVRIGVESVGIYSESNVRGFSLQDAGNYRLEGAYFVRSAQPANALVAGSSTRVGISALRADFPGPSGIVEFALRQPTGGTNLFLETGRRANSGPFVELNADSGSSTSRLSVVAGLHIYPEQTYADGSKGDFVGGGIAPTWRPAAGVAITGVATRTAWSTQSDSGFVAATDVLPDPVRPRVYRGQSWTRTRIDTSVTGLRAVVEPGDGWMLRASLFRSESATKRADFNLFEITDPGGRADLTAFLVPENSSRSWAGELHAFRSWRSGRAEHRLVAMARSRDTRSLVRSGSAVALGRVNVYDAPVRFADPGRPDRGPAQSDAIDQWAFGAGYRLSLGDAIEVRGDAQRTRYAKAIDGVDGRTRTVATPWLYSGSVVVGATPKATVFASYTRGLEESGVAPNNAVNRNAVLPPVIAEQSEIGFRYEVTPTLSLIGAGFSIGKDTPALREDGVFALVGRARHRGVELSLTGRLGDHVSIVVGGLDLRARVAGALVDSGRVGPRAVGRPDRIGFANVTWRMPAVEGLAVDASVSYRGREYADRRNLLRTPGVATVNAGLRYRFDADGTPLVVRARVVNLWGVNAWDPTTSGLLFYNSPRSVALSITATL